MKFLSQFQKSLPIILSFIFIYINFLCFCEPENIDIFYFSSFDEPWKVGAEGDVGAFWGLWDKDEQLKYSELS